MRTSILIENLELYGFHGYFDEEQHLGQRFVFNVLANLALAETHLDNGFGASARYDQLIEEVERISNQTKFRTLETLGETIALGLLHRFDRIANIAVTVAKVSPPISQSLERVAVTIQLDR